MKPPPNRERTDPSLWVEAYGDALYAFALRRLGSATDAEDAVQECLAAALGASRAFVGPVGAAPGVKLDSNSGLTDLYFCFRL